MCVSVVPNPTAEGLTAEGGCHTPPGHGQVDQEACGSVFVLYICLCVCVCACTMSYMYTSFTHRS